MCAEQSTTSGAETSEVASEFEEGPMQVARKIPIVEEVPPVHQSESNGSWTSCFRTGPL